MKLIKFLVVCALERSCTMLDQIPRYDDGRWYRNGCWGCYPLRLAYLSAHLEEKWHTGWWMSQ